MPDIDDLRAAIEDKIPDKKGALIHDINELF